MQRHIASILCLMGVLLLSIAVANAAEPSELKLPTAEGTKAHYKNSFSFRYSSNGADMVLPRREGEGRVMIQIRGEWRSSEEPYSKAGEVEHPFQEGEVGVLATIDRASQSVEVQGQRLTMRQLPNPLDALDGRQFSWRYRANGAAALFEPRFKTYELPNRAMVPDLYQLWMPHVHPLLPEGPVKKGDRWEGEQTVMDTPTGRAKIHSTYEVKKTEEKKGSTILTIDESRKVDYLYVLNSAVVVLVLEGEGEGTGEWKFDATKGVVLDHKMQVDLKHPSVTRAGQSTPIHEVRADVRFAFKRELDKFEE